MAKSPKHLPGTVPDPGPPAPVMNPRDALERALGWGEAAERIRVKDGVAEPRRKTDPLCQSDAEAWNMLSRLKGLV